MKRWRRQTVLNKEFQVVNPNSPENATKLRSFTTRTHVIDLRLAKLRLMFEFRMQILCSASSSARFQRNFVAKRAFTAVINNLNLCSRHTLRGSWGNIIKWVGIIISIRRFILFIMSYARVYTFNLTAKRAKAHKHSNKSLANFPSLLSEFSAWNLLGKSIHGNFLRSLSNKFKLDKNVSSPSRHFE